MIKYTAKYKSKPICVCIVDDTNQYDAWNRELVKNRADYTITNCTGMGYDVFVHNDVDKILQYVSKYYTSAVIISPGTEFINGNEFFNLPEHFSLLAHILDSGDGYYMIHPQCYVLNLEVYNSIELPNIGHTEYFNSVTLPIPTRSKENIHDEYTPLWINPGKTVQKYCHRLHGWHLIKTMLDYNFTIDAFSNQQRDNKHYLYQDADTASWIYKRYNYCISSHVYQENTGVNLLPTGNDAVKNLIVPAAGMNWYETIKGYKDIDKCCVKFYDYNSAALAWIKIQTENITNIEFEFHHIDILSDPDAFLNLVDSDTDYVEFSNIFAYEATAALMPMKYRLEIQNNLIKKIANKNQNCYLHFDQRAEDGFVINDYSAVPAGQVKINHWKDLDLPPWHQSSF